MTLKTQIESAEFEEAVIFGELTVIEMVSAEFIGQFELLDRRGSLN